MDGIVDRLKASLNSLEDQFKKEDRPTFFTEIMNYFMYTNKKDYLDEALNVQDRNDKDYDDSLSDDEEENIKLEDDLVSDNEEEDNDIDMVEDDENKCGLMLKMIWKK
jgi:hypothetical protein